MIEELRQSVFMRNSWRQRSFPKIRSFSRSFFKSPVLTEKKEDIKEKKYKRNINNKSWKEKEDEDSIPSRSISLSSGPLHSWESNS